MVRMPFQSLARLGQLPDELGIPRGNLCATRQALGLRSIRQPVSNFGDRNSRAPAVRVNVLAGDIRYGSTIAVRLTIQNQTGLLTLRSRSEVVCETIRAG